MRTSGLLVLLVCLAGCSRESTQRPARSDPGVVLPGGELDRRAYLGRRLYARHCEICHGTAGAGDGFNSYNLDPRPRDLRGLVGDVGIGHLREVILDGSAAVGRSPLCPPRRHTLRGEEPELVLAYLLTLKGG